MTTTTATRTHASSTRPYPVGEEIANSVTHGVGLALSVAGLTVLVVFASLRGNPWAIVGSSIFGASLILTYLASTLYHAIPSPRALASMRRAMASVVAAGVPGGRLSTICRTSSRTRSSMVG